MKTFVSFFATTILAATTLASGPAVAQQKTVFKASDVHPAGYPTVVAVKISQETRCSYEWPL